MGESTSKTTPRSKSGWFSSVVKWKSEPDQVSINYWGRSWTDVVVGSKNPRWKAQVASGRQAGTSLTGDRTVITHAPYFVMQETRRADGSWPTSVPVLKIKEGYYTPPNIPSSPITLSESLANARALEILIRKIRSTQTTLYGGVVVGEIAQTIKLITNPVSALRKSFDVFRRDIQLLRRKIPRSAGTAKKRVNMIVDAARDTWLEYQLGWAPLISDADAGIQALAESKVMTDHIWKPIRAVGIEKIPLTETTADYVSSYPKIRFTKSSFSEVSVRYIACVDCGSYNALSAQRVGFAPTNWLPTVWELIPYSFVIDYFSNIGQIIEGASIARSSVRWIIKTVRRSVKHKYSNFMPIKPVPSGGNYHSIVGFLPGSCDLERTSIARAPYYGSLVPDLNFKIPGSATQWLNLAALGHAKSQQELRTYYR